MHKYYRMEDLILEFKKRITLNLAEALSSFDINGSVLLQDRAAKQNYSNLRGFTLR